MEMSEGGSNRLNIRCPCCGEIFDARELARRLVNRNNYGIDVFACVECNERIKFDPYEYYGVRELMSRGEIAQGMAIEAYKNAQLMPCEKEARKEMGWFARLFAR